MNVEPQLKMVNPGLTSKRVAGISEFLTSVMKLFI